MAFQDIYLAPQESKARALKWLTSAELRPTKQRVALAELLVGDGQDRHVTAESLFETAMTKGSVHVSLATVYNTLKAFCEVGLMNEVTVDGSKSFFDTRMDDHPHFFWEEDRLISDAPKESVKLDRLPKAPDGTEISRVDVVIRLRKSDRA